MKKRETLSKGEELLAQVLEECLEEDLSFVPPEREIARTHRFSENFEKTVRAFLEQSSQNQKKQEIQKHFHPRYAHLAACVLVFCVCGWLLVQVMGLFGSKGAASADTSAAMDMEAGNVEVTEEEAEEAAPEEAEPAEGTGAGEEIQKQREYCGQTVRLAEQQEVPEHLDNVTTLVNCPVQDADNPVLCLTIGNVGEEAVKYLDQYELQVWLQNGWYVIPSGAEGSGKWLELKAGMAVDEEINLSSYQIDFGAEQYRLIAQVDDRMVSAEFTFEEVFSKQMEKLEEEETSKE